MNARCEECGSPVVLTHDGEFVCARDKGHFKPIKLREEAMSETMSNALRDQLQKALNVRFGLAVPGNSMPATACWVMDFNDSKVVYSFNGNWELDYTVGEGGQITLGDVPREVAQSWTPTSVAMGGPGSGWSASGGHVKHDKAAEAHHAAARAHSAVASAIEKVPSNEYGLGGLHTGTPQRGSMVDNAARATKDATSASKQAGAGKLYAAQAAQSYAKTAATTTGKSDQQARVAAHREAAKYHTAAARAHEAFGSQKGTK